MSPLDRQALTDFVNSEIVTFHQSRLAVLRRLRLDVALQDQNPYELRLRHATAVGGLVLAILEDYAPLSVDKWLNHFLVDLAVQVARMACDGRPSDFSGIDVEMDKTGIHYVVAIKSGPDWGDGAQYANLEETFKHALAVQQPRRGLDRVQAVLGLCYGRSPRFPDTGVYCTMAGQVFWHFLSGDHNLYADIIDLVASHICRYCDELEYERAAAANRLTSEFIHRFCDSNFAIDWQRVVQSISGDISSSQLLPG